METKTNWRKKTVLVNKSVLFVVEEYVSIFSACRYSPHWTRTFQVWDSDEIEANTSILPWNTYHETDLLHPRRNQLVKMKDNFIIAAVFSCLAVLGVGTVLGTQAAKTGDKWAPRKVPVSDNISLCGKNKYFFLSYFYFFKWWPYT